MSLYIHPMCVDMYQYQKRLTVSNLFILDSRYPHLYTLYPNLSESYAQVASLNMVNVYGDICVICDPHAIKGAFAFELSAPGGAVCLHPLQFEV